MRPAKERSLRFILLFIFFFTNDHIQAQVSQLGLGFGGSLMDYCIDQKGTIWVGVDVSGLYKSDDRGASWDRMNNQVVSEHISEIFVHPDDANLMLLGTRGALLRSIDRGETWTDIRAGLPSPKTSGNSSVAIVSIVADPFNTDILYAAHGDRREAAKKSMSTAEAEYGRGTIYKSEDRGLTWTNLRTVYLQDIHALANIFSLAISNQVEGVLFAASSRGLYKSTDAGKNFKKVQGLPHDRVTAVALAPNNNNEVYLTLDYEDANGYGIYKSENFGKSWASANDGIPQTYEGGVLKPYHLIVDWKDNKTVYMASTESGSIWKSTNAGESWENTYRFKVQDQGWSSYGTKYLKAYGFAISPIDNEFLIAGEHWSHKTSDGGDSWYQVYSTNTSPYKNRGADFTVSDYVSPSPIVENLVLMGQYDNGLYRSTNAGSTWENKSSEMRKGGVSSYLTAVTDIAYAANGDIYVAIDMSYYIAGGGGFVIKKSTNNGATWSIVLDAKSGSGSEFYDYGIYHGLETHPTEGDIVYVTSYDPSGHMTIKSSDAGATWTKLGSQPDNRRIRQLKIDESDADIMYAVAGTASGKEGRIYKSSDAGVSWSSIMKSSDYRDYRDMTIDPNNNDILYAAVTPNSSVGGIYKSTDGGENWSALVTATVGTKGDRLTSEIAANGGLFGATSVKVHPDDSDIILATFGAATGQYFGDYRPGYGLGYSKDGGISWDIIGRSSIKFGRLYHIEFDAFNHDIIYTGTGGSGGFKINLGELIDEDDKFAQFIDMLENDPSLVTVEVLGDLGLTQVSAAKLESYKSQLVVDKESLYMASQVQYVIDQVNEGNPTPLEKLQELLANDQSQLVTMQLLDEVGLENLNPELLFQYQMDMDLLDGSSTLAEMQSVIDVANIEGSLQLMNTFLQRSDSTFDSKFLTYLDLDGANPAYIRDYKESLLTLEDPLTLTVSSYQSVVDTVNAIKVEEEKENEEITSVEDNKTLISIYPNPVSNVLNINLGEVNESAIAVSILDLSGKVKMNKTFEKGAALQIEVRNLPLGIYLIKVESENRKETIPFVKK